MAVPFGAAGGAPDRGAGRREDSISELVAARLLRFFSQIFGGWIATVPGLEETLRKAGGGNVVSMLEKAGTAFEIGFGGDEQERAVIGGFFTGLRDALKDVKDPGEASTKMEAFLGGPAAKALIAKKDMLGKQPLMSFAEALSRMAEGNDKNMIRIALQTLNGDQAKVVLARLATPAILHGLAEVRWANGAISGLDLFLTLPEPPKKGAEKVASEAQLALKAVKDLLDLLKSEEDPNDPAVKAARQKHEEALRLTRRRAMGMRRVQTMVKQGESSGWFGRLLFTLIVLAIAFLVVWRLSFLRS